MTATPDPSNQPVLIGNIHKIQGNQIEVSAAPELMQQIHDGLSDRLKLFETGSILTIPYSGHQLYAFATGSAYQNTQSGHLPSILLSATLFGESRDAQTNTESAFHRGISTYPVLQTQAYSTTKDNLTRIYSTDQTQGLELGTYKGVTDMPCTLDVNGLLSQASTVIGSSGTGKSATTAAILHALLELGPAQNLPHWQPRIIIIDPHGEYHGSFPDHIRLCSTDSTLTLPYWLLDLQELIHLLIDPQSRTALSESDILRRALIRVRQEAADHYNYQAAQVTADSPVPFMLGSSDSFNELGRESGNSLYIEGLIGKINLERPNTLDKDKHELYNRLIYKIELLKADARLAFIMRESTIYESEAPLQDIIGQLIDTAGKPVIIDLSGLPQEIASVLCGAIARTIFNLKIWQSETERKKSPVLLVCEEAHRYAGQHLDYQSSSAQTAIRRIAKEGRKYGLGLMLVSQRPSELDETALSQCTTWIVLRLNNEKDLAQVEALLPDTFAPLAALLPGLQMREALLVGTATKMPANIMIRKLPADKLPASSSTDFVAGWQQGPLNPEQIHQAVMRWVHHERLEPM
ncbi:MAG: ATP-binding protein [Gammaproteobacteria bacterium]